MSERNKAIARDEFDVWNSGDLDRLDDLVAPDVVHHDPYDPNGADGLEGLKRTIADYRAAFPDVRFTVEDQVAEGDKVVTRWRSTGTHDGEWMGRPPTGRRTVVTGIAIERFEDGRIVESWRNYDVLGMLQSIGAITPAPASG